MDHRIEIVAESLEREHQWASELSAVLEQIDYSPESINLSHSGKKTESESAIVFVDAHQADVEGRLKSLEREGRSVILLVDEQEGSWDPSSTIADWVDDVLVHPFRTLEVESKIRLHHLLRAWSEVHQMNLSFQQLLENLSDDVMLTERLQKANLPVRFPSVKGFRVRSRYLAGMRNGGDHFDLADSRDGSRITVLLSDSSSHGLSSAFLGSLMTVTLKLSRDEIRSATDTIRVIHDDVARVLKEKDHLSLLYGVLNRRDLKFRFLQLGSSLLFHAPAGQPFRVFQSEYAPISQASGLPSALEEREIELNANDRLVLLSDGYVERAGGVEESLRILNSLRERDSEDTLNEFTFQVKRRFTEEDDIPEQDCSAIVMDVDSRVLKLA